MWEYVVVYLNPASDSPEDEQDILDEFGENGWELVSVIGSIGQDRFGYMKRPLKPTEAP